MKRMLAVSLLALFALALAPSAEAARARVVHRGRRTVVTVHRGFPLHRTLPHVYVRAPRVAVRVVPRVFLPVVVFRPVVVAAPAAGVSVWRDAEVIERDEGWTELTMNVDRRGKQLVLGIDRSPAQISFAEVVFENGDAQVIDFADRPHRQGTFSLLDFKDGRKVDHVRVVAKADGPSSEISRHLLA
jgi:hypothetical protein